MNVTDVKAEEVKAKEGDMLAAVFQEQRILMAKYRDIEKNQGLYIPDKLSIDSPKDQEYLRMSFMRIIQELCESAECLRNKPWKQSHVVTDLDHMKEEIADAFHFFAELCIELGMTAEELFTYYMKKNKVNQFRQRSKY